MTFYQNICQPDCEAQKMIWSIGFDHDFDTHAMRNIFLCFVVQCLSTASAGELLVTVSGRVNRESVIFADFVTVCLGKVGFETTNGVLQP
eukprot:5570148-Ditylum_brightwellii.AAC.1